MNFSNFLVKVEGHPAVSSLFSSPSSMTTPLDDPQMFQLSRSHHSFLRPYSHAHCPVYPSLFFFISSPDHSDEEVNEDCTGIIWGWDKMEEECHRDMREGSLVNYTLWTHRRISLPLLFYSCTGLAYPCTQSKPTLRYPKDVNR